jgi:hypothetical protein
MQNNLVAGHWTVIVKNLELRQEGFRIPPCVIFAQEGSLKYTLTLLSGDIP